MNALKEAVYRAVHGEGGLVFIHGEAGIGKTRLVRELGAYARSRGVQVLYGRCPALFRMDGVPPYILWREVIKDYLETCNLEQLYRVIGYYPAEVAKLVPELGQKLRSFPQSLPISPEQEQNRLFEAVSQFITNISQETPLLVVLDDLQWTDPSSLLLLHYLARDVQKSSLLLLGAYRDTDIDSKHPLTPVLAELNRESFPQSIHLKRMSLSDVSEMIKNILEQEAVPSEFCRLVYEKTGGNPFFVGEVVKSLKEEDVIYREENRWEFKEVSKIEFPETVKSVLKTRFARLDEECQSVLTFASFVGNDFTLEAMCALTGIEENKLLELMDKILKTGLIKEREVRGEGVCSFSDILVRDVVYDEVSLLKRKKLHGVVGCALEKVYAKKIEEHLGEPASHFLESGNKEKALSYFLKAAEKAQKIYANNEAASYFQSALMLLKESESRPHDRGHVLERLGDIKKLVGEYDVCLKHWNETLLLWEQLKEKESTSRLHRKIADVLWSEEGEPEKAKVHYEEALKILEKEAESVELASLLENMARLYLNTESVTKGLSYAEKALELATKLNDHEVIARSYATIGVSFSNAGNDEKGVECHERALKIALDNGYVEIALREYNNLAASLPEEENERKEEYAEKGYELAKKVGATKWISWIGTGLASTHIDMGNIDKALPLAEQSVELDKKAGNMSNLCWSKNTLGFAYHILGEWDRSEQYHREALSVAQKAKNIQQTVSSYGYLGLLDADRGEHVRAKEQFEKALEVSVKANWKPAQMYTSLRIAAMKIALGESEGAAKLIGEAQRFAMETKDKLFIAFTYAIKAMLLRAQKSWKESIEFFEKSLQEFESFNGRRWWAYWLAKIVLYEYAGLYLESDQEGDREKARDLFSQALEIFQKMGAKKDIEKVEAKLLYIETGKVASVHKPIDLVCTGYADLDKLLCGGLPPSYEVVLTSPSCDERDVLVKSFLEAGAKNGEVTFYVTIDPSVAKALAETFVSNLQLFVCNPEADAIIKSSPNVYTLKGVENLTDISIALTSAIRRLDASLKGPRRICLGLVSDVLLQHHAVETRRWLTALMTKLKSEDFTTLAVVDPKMHPSEELYAILGLFEGEINIYEKETGKGSERFLKIKKMANQRYLKDELLLKGEDPQK
jgi:tetratricopeptide (TPR) repeat protein/KaiC/GvpD/RAD55 family RecA-like ATPase